MSEVAGQVGQAVARERLRSRLVDLRRLSRLSPEDVVAHTRWSTSKLNRIETGSVTVQPLDVQALLRLYGVHDQDESARLVELAVRARRREWWSGFGLDPIERDFVAYENEASRITVYESLVIPQLLQTPAYARAAATGTPGSKPDDARTQALVDVRMRRQEELRARLHHGAARLVVILDEAVLRRPIGGATVMRGQLDRLLSASTDDDVRLAVVPLRSGVQPGPGGAFELLEFAGSSDPDVVFVESAVRPLLLKDPDDTSLFHDAIDVLNGHGLTRDAARAAILNSRP